MSTMNVLEFLQFIQYQPLSKNSFVLITVSSCPAGQYNDGPKQLCSYCSPGSYNDETGSSSCKLCSPGTYMDYFLYGENSSGNTCITILITQKLNFH